MKNETAKANFVADMSGALVTVPEGIHYIDGRSVTPDSGGIFKSSNDVYSLARPDAVPPYTQTGTEPGDITKNRLGRITINNRFTSNTKYGVELESFRIHPDSGEYVPDWSENALPELYRYMDEVSTRPVDSAGELHEELLSVSKLLIKGADAVGALVLPASTLGQRSPTPNEINPSPYVQHIAKVMEQITGFNTVETFRVAGMQNHTEIDNTEAAIKAAEAMQLLRPILMSPSLAGPFLHGGITDIFTQTRHLNHKQQLHLRSVGIIKEDLIGGYASWRYLLRRVGSPSAGTWLHPAEDNLENYLWTANDELRSGKINNPDRHMGEHTDRLRLVLDGSNVSTLENCANDTFGGNIQSILSAVLLDSAIFKSLERMAMHGEEPREIVAKTLGLAGQSHQQRLHSAHRASLAVSRNGNDAIIYGKTPEQWADPMLSLARESGLTPLGDRTETTLRKMFAGSKIVTAAINDWCYNGNTDTPSLAAYFDSGYGNPSFHMQAVYRKYKYDNPGSSEEVVIRAIELDLARAYQESINKLANAI